MEEYLFPVPLRYNFFNKFYIVADIRQRPICPVKKPLVISDIGNPGLELRSAATGFIDFLARFFAFVIQFGRLFLRR